MGVESDGKGEWGRRATWTREMALNTVTVREWKENLGDDRGGGRDGNDAQPGREG